MGNPSSPGGSAEPGPELLDPRDAIVLLDTSGRITFVTDSVTDLVGWKVDDLTGRPAFELVHPDDLATLLTAASRRLEGDDPETSALPMRLLTPEGTWEEIEVEGALLDDETGPATAAVLSLRDVAGRREADAALRRSEERFRALMEHSTDAIIVIDPDLRITYASPAVHHLFGYEPADLFGMAGSQFVHPDDIELLAERSLPVFTQPGGTATFELRARHADGRMLWVEVTYLNLVEDPRVGGVVAHVRDITERRTFQDLSERLTAVFQSTPDIIGLADEHGRLQFLNRAGRHFIGITDDAPLRGTALDVFLPPGGVERLGPQIADALARTGRWSGEVTLRRVDGEDVPMSAELLAHRDERSGRSYFSGQLRDISERKAMEGRLAHQATHDPLTGLPNRTLLLDRLEHALARTSRQREDHPPSLAVLFCDLDHFKVVNDSLGHGAGDLLLLAIAERIGAVVRPGDTVGRFGGDEFVVLCEDLDDPATEAAAVAERIIAALTEPFQIDDAEVFIGVSIGVAVPESTAADAGTLIRDADSAMYRAKEKGRARWERFDHAMRAIAVARLDTENALRRSIERRELRVHYQPVIDLGTGGVVGVEALLRWEHPERGLLGPADFIRIAEETGLIVPIGTWVLEQACRQVQRWRASNRGLGRLSIAVNLSGRQLASPTLVDDVARVLHETGIEPSTVELEITESVLMDDVEMSSETLNRLRGLGVRLAVDDFGTGYSSLAYLRRFPVDVLKVDRSFVAGLGGFRSDAAIVTAVISLAHTLGLHAIAEGVETPAQLAELRELGCDQAQGYLFARPLSGDACGELLASTPVW